MMFVAAVRYAWLDHFMLIRHQALHLEGAIHVESPLHLPRKRKPKRCRNGSCNGPETATC